MPNWFKTYDATNTLSLNVLQYISDEVDACDESVISVKDYTTTPAEYFGAKDLALLKRVNLVRTTPFHRLPIPMQDDLRNCFKLEDTEFIDLRCKKIKELDILNQKLKKMNNNQNSNNSTPKKQKETTIKQSSPPNSNQDPSTEWVFGVGPLQKEIIKKLKAENSKLENLNKNQSLEEGEIQDEDDDVDNKNQRNNPKFHRRRKRRRSEYEFYDNHNGHNGQNSFRNRNSNKNFQTKISKEMLKEDLFHCGLETYKYVKPVNNNSNSNSNNSNNSNNGNYTNKKSTNNVDIDGDDYFMNWCIQRFEYDSNQHCVLAEPEIQKIETKQDDNNDNIYRIPTPNYTVTGTTPIATFDSGISPMTPGYGISPMTNGYGGSQHSLTPQRIGINDNDSTNGDNEPYWKRSYAQNSQVNDDLNSSFSSNLNDSIDDVSNNQPPLKKMKLNHHKK